MKLKQTLLKRIAMPFLIDGHNLIAQVPDIRLDDPDDEARLISLLRTFCARTGRGVTVYFDHRSPGSQNPPSAGGLSVHFVTPPRTADEAIQAHLQRLQEEARNWTVVSSDRAVQLAARQSGARSLSSNTFTHQLMGGETAPEITEKPDAPSSEEEIAWWESLFRQEDQGI